MKLEIVQKGKYRILKILEKVETEGGFKELSEILNKMVAHGQHHLILDFSALNFVDLRILNVVNALWKKIEVENGSIDFISGNNNLDEVISLTGMDEFTTIFKSQSAVYDSITASDQPVEKLESGSEKIELRAIGKYKVFKVNDELTMPEMEKIKALVNGLAQQGDKFFVFDFAALTLVNSALLGMLATIFLRVQKKRGEVTVLTDKEEVKEILGLGNFNQLFSIYSSQDEFIQKAVAKGEDLSSPTIMVVDDSKTMRELLKTQIQAMGYQVLEAENGEEGVRMAKEKRPNLIIMDVDMPLKNGFEACLQIKQEIRDTYIPIIFNTSMDAEKDRFMALECQGDDYIIKPFNDADLIFRIRTHLRIQKLIKQLK